MVLQTNGLWIPLPASPGDNLVSSVLRKRAPHAAPPLSLGKLRSALPHVAEGLEGIHPWTLSPRGGRSRQPSWARECMLKRPCSTPTTRGQCQGRPPPPPWWQCPPRCLRGKHHRGILEDTGYLTRFKVDASLSGNRSFCNPHYTEWSLDTLRSQNGRVSKEKLQKYPNSDVKKTLCKNQEQSQGKHRE